MQTSPQVTAAQVLDAGRRAEADGRVDYAVQFYRHLADHHASAPEAQIAREALSRLKRQAVNGEGGVSSKSAAPPPLRSPRSHSTADISSSNSRSGRKPIRLAPVGKGNLPEIVELPEPARAYLVGRLIAHAFAVLGTLLIVAGLVAAGAVAFLPSEVAARVPVWLTSHHPLTGLVAALLGFGLIFSGQLARAVFDMADASRELAAIERAKVEHANGVLS